MALEVATARRDDLVIVTLSGELDIYTVPGFRREMADVDPVECALILDMAAVSLIDSSGLGALVSLRSRAANAGRRVGLAAPPSQVLRVLEITGLRSTFTVAASVDAVLAASLVIAPPAEEA
jgi:anti-anti-sigma factor